MNYDSLVVPEALSAVEPRDLVVDTLKALRALTPRLADITELSLKSEPARSGYHVWDIPLSDITPVPGDGRTSHYSVPCAGTNIDAIGVGFNETIGLRGYDFQRDGSVYIFKEHPTTYGTVSVIGDKSYLTTLCFGSDLQGILDPLGIAFHGCPDTATRSAIEDTLYANAPAGVSHLLIEAIAGCHLSAKPLVVTWTEGTDFIYDLGVTTEGELVYAPKSLNLPFAPGNIVDLNTLDAVEPVINESSDVYYAKLRSGGALVKAGQNAVSSYPNIVKDYPALPVHDGFFSGVDLLAILLKDGCVFHRPQYINESAGAQKALSNYAVNPGKVTIEVIAEAEGSITTDIEELPTPDLVDLSNFKSTAKGYNFL